MANPYAGEVSLTLNGETFALKLTLGALAELEAELEAGSLVAVVERFEAGQYSTRDVLLLLKAGLRGAGWPGGLRDLADAEIAGGPVVAARAPATLLARAFAIPGQGDAG